MSDTDFASWLVSNRGLRQNTADSYAARAHAIEEKLGVALVSDWSGTRLKSARDHVDADGDLGSKTKADYKTALNAYADYCAS